MGLSPEDSHSQNVFTRQKLVSAGLDASGDPLNRAFYEGSVAGFDGTSAINNPYVRGPLRYRWFDGHTFGRQQKAADKKGVANVKQFGIENRRFGVGCEGQGAGD